MARIRFVHPADMVAHLWAHKSQDSARVSGSGNFFFRGDTIYSYGSHFPIARHVANKRGESAVLFTTHSYSVTTSGHKSMVAGACRHLTVFHVADVYGSDHRKQFADYRARYVELARKYAKSRQNKPYVLSELRGVVEEANRYAAFFGLRARLALPDDLSAMAEECKAIEKRERERKQREEAKRQREARERLQKWVDGDSDYCPNGYGEPIRLRIKGEELQTSRGARVPLEHAVKAFRTIKRLHDKGQAYERNGHTIHLGHFALDAIDSAGNVRAGCHEVAWEEIARVATLAGVN
jgi:hypothetical protein